MLWHHKFTETHKVHTQLISCFSLNLEHPSKAPVLKAWSGVESRASGVDSILIPGVEQSSVC